MADKYGTKDQREPKVRNLRNLTLNNGGKSRIALMAEGWHG